MSDKQELIEEILGHELEMFQNVRSKYPVSCQQDPDAFRLHRGSQFLVWSDETLSSYRDDLVKAKSDGKNLMTLKYARMENIIPPLNENPIIEEIANLELKSQKKMAEKYPNIIGRARPLTDDGGATSFLTYLKGELETYSDKTLELLLRDIKNCVKNGDNWTELIYTQLVKKMGFETIAQVECKIADKKD
jgi:Protein of unknown function (DUF4125)